MRRDHAQVEAPEFGGAGDVIALGHYGRPVLVLPADGGRAWECEDNGLLEGVRGLVEGGAAKLYCVDGPAAESWSARDGSMDDAAREAAYQSWILDNVVPFVYADCSGPIEMVVTGAGLGAVLAARFALRRADLFPAAICLSGRYADVGGGGAIDYLNSLEQHQLDWLRDRVNVVLVSGSGPQEHALGTLEATRRLASALEGCGIHHQLDIWDQTADHNGPSWSRQLAHHLPRFCS
jgi:esterase/lipase superfamily enzyme